MTRKALVRAHAGHWIARPADANAQPMPPEILLKRDELLAWLPEVEGGAIVPLRTLRVTVPTLNVREQPGTAQRRVGTLRAGTVVQVTVAERSANGLQWAELYREGQPAGWIAVMHTQPVQSTPGGGGQRGRGAIGFHVAGGAVPPALLPTIRVLAEAERPLSALVSVTHKTLCNEVKSLSPTTYVVYRHWIGEDSFNPATANPERWESGEEWLQRFLPHLDGVSANAFQFANEWYKDALRRGGAARYAQFYVELMEACRRRGIRCTVGDFNVGHVEPDELPALAPLFEVAENLGMVLNYHAYSTAEGDDTDMHESAEFYALRWTKWVRAYPKLRVLLGEAGKYFAPRFVNTALTLRMMRDHAQQLEPYADQLIGSCWWTLAGHPGGWEADDFTLALIAVRDWLLG